MWFVYILECSDGTFYTGITTSLDRRLIEHNETSKGAKYTRARRPVKLIAHCIVKDRSAALKLESKVKSLKKSEKIAYLTKEKSNDLEYTR